MITVDGVSFWGINKKNYPRSLSFLVNLVLQTKLESHRFLPTEDAIRNAWMWSTSLNQSKCNLKSLLKHLKFTTATSYLRCFSTTHGMPWQPQKKESGMGRWKGILIPSKSPLLIGFFPMEVPVILFRQDGLIETLDKRDCLGSISREARYVWSSSRRRLTSSR